MANYSKHFGAKNTPQTEPIPNAKTPQVANNAGGYVWAVDDFTRLNRFLVLGSEGNTYYQTEKELSRENAECVVRCIKQDGPRTVNTITEISDAGRAPKNDPAIFALALCVALGDPETRAAALTALPKVCRIGTHLFNFLRDYEAIGNAGYGRAVRRALAAWYTEKPVERLAQQLLKYANRAGWTHTDVLRLAHPSNVAPEYQALFRRTVAEDKMGVRNVKRVFKAANGKFKEVRTDKYKSLNSVKLPQIVQSFDQIRTATNTKEVIRVINADKNVTWEMIPTEHLAKPEVWAALLPNMPLTAMIRNLGRMTANGALTKLSDEVKHVVNEITNAERIHKARVHPIQMLAALKTYESGHGVRGSLTWNPISQIVDALDDGFYASFDNVEPTGKNIVLALDVSGSMGCGEIAGIPGLTPRIASAAMAMVIAKTEKNYTTIAFTSGGGRWNSPNNTAITELSISPKMRLDTVIQKVSELQFGGTDCALPMLWALEKKLHANAFVVITDNETWAGAIHPSQALVKYRQLLVKDAKLAVIGMTATEFSIASPNDSGMMDFVGFDTAAPQLLSDFISGKF